MALGLWARLSMMPAPAAVTLPRPRTTMAANHWPSISTHPVGKNQTFSAPIASVQYMLRDRGFYQGKADGLYSSKTVAAIKAFQKSQNMLETGVAEKETLSRLVTPLSVGDQGDKVRAAQILARGVIGPNGETPNLGLEVNGIYAQETFRAVRRAQQIKSGPNGRVAADGQMNLDSWCLMLGGKTAS
jgi:hypothetical protein